MESIAEASPIEKPSVVAVIPEALFSKFSRIIPVRIPVQSGERMVEIFSEIRRLVQTRSYSLIASLHLVETLTEPGVSAPYPLVPDLMGEYIPTPCREDGVRGRVIA